ncbi:hypothetical protein D3C71_873140 [compost metagenome]
MVALALGSPAIARPSVELAIGLNEVILEGRDCLSSAIDLPVIPDFSSLTLI